MKLENLFEKKVDRSIEGVIKADDDASLRLELDEYVITDEVGKRLDDFFDAYLNYSGANGVWISGFFGSGKSHLLKMLAMLLENRKVDGTSALDIFLAKPKCRDDQIFANDLKLAVAIPSESILFNIDQKADVISKTEIDALISVFVKVFDEHCGYYGKQPYIAQFERELDADNLFLTFKSEFQSLSGMDWEKGRQRAKRMEGEIDAAYRKVTGQKTENILDKYRTDYRLSIEDFAEQVSSYIATKDKNFRLNFFVDEVGQYVADNTKLMTNLQTVAESLATHCKGQAWVVVTAQEDMTTVIGEEGKQQNDDFSKIQARFKNRMKLTSQDVAEVIQMRLLHKKEEFFQDLGALYHQQENNFKTLFDFSDGAQSYRNYRDKEHFIQSYPFVPYQVALFQTVIQSLSKHNAFEGKHSSVGERSMLGVFQQVAVTIKDHELGDLATFDLMFEGIRTALKTAIQQSILKAERQLDSPFAIRLLKALFLVKYVKEFKSTIRNLCVLMHDSFSRDIPSLRNEVEQALNLLESQTYIQRNGEFFEYLTDEEQDIEAEIKNTEVDSQKVSEELEKLVYDGVLKTRKIRFEETNQDYPFSRRLDDNLLGRDYELGINIITSFHEHPDAIEKHKSDTVFNDELRILFPASDRLVRDLIMYKRTEKYVSHETKSVQQESIKRILDEKRNQNAERLNQLKLLASKLAANARYFVGGLELELSGEDGQTKMIRAFHELIRRTYPNLKMLRGVQFSENQVPDILKQATQGLFANDATLPESEQEMLSFIQSNSRGGVRTTVKLLLEKFEIKPYGWSFATVLCVLSYLCARNKVEIRESTNLLDESDLVRALRNTAAHGNLIIDPQVEFTQSQLRAVKEFYSDYFDKLAHATEAKALAKEVQQAFEEQTKLLDKLQAQENQYPFLRGLMPVIADLQELKNKPYTWFIAELPNQESKWFDYKEKSIDPMLSFMKGQQKAIYDSAKKLLVTQKPNLGYLESGLADKVEALLLEPGVYKGSQVQQLKELADAIEQQLNAIVGFEKTTALNTLSSLKETLQGFAEFKSLTSEQQSQLLNSFEGASQRLSDQVIVAVIRDDIRRFEDETYSALVQKIMVWSQPTPTASVATAAPVVGDYPLPAAKDSAVIVESLQEPKPIKLKELKVQFSKPWLSSEADVDAYVEELRKTLFAALKSGKNIQL